MAATKAGGSGKRVTKKKTSKKTTAKKVAKGSATSGQYGVERDHDLPWTDKKVAIFKALKALGATSATKARSAKDVADKAGVTPNDVRHYGYHAKAGGLTDVVTIEGIRGYAFHLTAAGTKVDPVKELKKQQTKD